MRRHLEQPLAAATALYGCGVTLRRMRNVNAALDVDPDAGGARIAGAAHLHRGVCLLCLRRRREAQDALRRARDDATIDRSSADSDDIARARRAPASAAV